MTLKSFEDFVAEKEKQQPAPPTGDAPTKEPTGEGDGENPEGEGDD